MKGLERYKKIKDLGGGAQGNVILADDTKLNRKVAIKSLHQTLTSDKLHARRFEEEAKTLAGLRHPSVIDVYDIIANEDGCHLVMEYFEGHSLDQYMKSKIGHVTEEKAIEIFADILDAIKHIHNKNIIHRDIKPSNIMINDNSEIRLLDFGIAKNTENDPNLTVVGSSAGFTPMYMSPEHCKGTKIDKFSDIYSLGVTLWEMLAGEPPYKGLNQIQISNKVANESLPSLQQINPKVSSKMDVIVQKATNKNPGKRYPSCDSFKKDLIKLKKDILSSNTEFDKKPSMPLNFSTVKKFIIPYLYDIKPNLINLFFLLKLNLSLLKENIFLILDKNKPEKIKSNQNKINKIKKEILKNSRLVMTHKKEYAIYSGILWLFIFLIFAAVPSEEESKKTPKIEVQKPQIPTVNFKTSSVEKSESETSHAIIVELSNTYDSIVKVPLSYGGTASKYDFKKIIDTLEIPAGQKEGFINIKITNNDKYEEDETIIVNLKNTVINGQLGENTSFTYKIINDDKRKRRVTKRSDDDEKVDDEKDDDEKDDDEKEVNDSFKKIIENEYCERYTEPNKDGYFVTIRNKSKREFELKIWKKNKLIRSYHIRGEIRNLHYNNHVYYTNKGRLGEHHLINLKFPNESYLGTKNEAKKRRSFQYKGNTEYCKIIYK